MGLIKFLASFCLVSPVTSILSSGKVLIVPAAGRRSARELAARMRKGGVKVKNYYMQPNNTIRFKVDDPDRAIAIIESLD